MLHVVAVFRLAELALQLGGLVNLQLRRHPGEQLLPFLLRRLPLFGRRHVFEIGLFLYAVEQIEPCIQRETIEMIEPDVALLLCGVVAVGAIFAEDFPRGVGSGGRGG